MESFKVKNILFITLTNIGDVILTTPALGTLLKYFPQAKITVVASPQTVTFFKNNPSLYNVISYSKFSPWHEKIKLLFKLRKEKFDMVIDLKNTLLGFCSGAKYKTPLFKRYNERIYKKNIFLNILKTVFKKYFNLNLNSEKVPFYIWTSKEDERQAGHLLKECGCLQDKKLVAINPFARSDTKSWPFENFAKLMKQIKANSDSQIVLVGSKQDEEGCCRLMGESDSSICNLCGKTSLRILAEVLKRCSCLIANDSAPMHLGAAVDIPVIAIFGPTDPKKYAPRGLMHKIISADLDCQPCEKAQCIFGKKPADCLKKISVDIVFNKVMEVLRKF